MQQLKNFIRHGTFHGNQTPPPLSPGDSVEPRLSLTNPEPPRPQESKPEEGTTSSHR
jgi:hypothetical protein